MAIISDNNEQDNKPPSSSPVSAKPFKAALDPANPLGFLEAVFEFLGRESDIFKSDSLADAVVRMVKEKLESEDRKRKDKLQGLPGKPDKKGPLAPNIGNGLVLENYSWGQSIQEVNVNIPVPQGTESRFIVCDIKKNHLTVGLKGQPPIIDGELDRPVKVDDCFWSLEDQKSISVLLTKQDQMDWWKCVVKGEPELNTQKVEPETSRLSELNPETRSTVEKMMFDQRQRAMGRPTSNDMQKQEMLKKFMAQHPELDFSTVKIS